MKVITLYRPNSEFARSTEEFIREFERRTSKTIDRVNIDTPYGVRLMKLYGVMDHPTFIAVDDDGKLLQVWTGKPMPLINDIAAYAAERQQA